MRIPLKVHSVSEEMVKVTAQLNGADIEAEVPGLVVELVSADGRMAHTLRFVPEDMADAHALFMTGADIEALYQAPAAAPPPEA